MDRKADILFMMSSPDSPAVPTKRRIGRWIWLACFALLALFIGRCSAVLFQSSRGANSAVQLFHARFNADRYHDIYVAAGSALHKSTPEEKLTQFLDAVHQKLGDAKTAKRVNLSINSGTDGILATTIYQTKFASSEATETFTWRISGGELHLFGYNISAPGLILK